MGRRWAGQGEYRVQMHGVLKTGVSVFVERFRIRLLLAQADLRGVKLRHMEGKNRKTQQRTE